MAASNMSQPPQFLSEVGDPIIPWKRWKPLFDSYLLAIGGEKFSSVRKQDVLLHNLGVEGRHIYDSLDEIVMGRGEDEPENVYDMSVSMLEKHFGSKINVVLERHKFFSRVQGKHEKIGNYVASLKTLGRT